MRGPFATAAAFATGSPGGGHGPALRAGPARHVDQGHRRGRRDGCGRHQEPRPVAQGSQG
eukprot:5998131-Alexandrium_andersonii.AAC.1